MKANFNYDADKAIALCLEYSDDPETLKALINRLEISVVRGAVIPSPWQDKYKSLHYSVTVNGYSFPFYGSHNDAMAFEPQTNGHPLPFREAKKTDGRSQKGKRRFLVFDPLLHSLRLLHALREFGRFGV